MALTYAAPYPRVIREVTVNPASIAAASVGETSVTVPGIKTDMIVAVQADALEANLILGQPRVTAANTVAIRIANPTAAPIDPASQTFKFIGF